MKLSPKILALLLLIHLTPILKADDGHRLWLRYSKPDGTGLLKTYTSKAGTSSDSVSVSLLAETGKIAHLNCEGLTINRTVFNNKKTILFADIEGIMVFHGTIRLLELLQKHQNIAFINIISYTRISIRVLNKCNNSAFSVETRNLYQSTF